MNSINVTGRLTADPVARSTSDDTAVAEFRLAVQRRRGRRGEERGAVYVDVVAFGGPPARSSSTSPRAARSRSPAGSSTTSGRPRTAPAAQRHKVIADEVEFLGRRPEANDGESA